MTSHDSLYLRKTRPTDPLRWDEILEQLDDETINQGLSDEDEKSLKDHTDWN